MNKYIHAVYNNLVFFAINTVFFLAVTPLAIKVMGDDFFGLWSILYAILILSNIGTLGIASIVTKFSAEVQPDDPRREQALGEILSGATLIVLVMSVAVAGLYLAARSWIAGWLAIAPEWQAQFRSALGLIALSVFPLFLSKVIQGFLLARLETGLVRQIEIATSIVLWLGVVLVVRFLGKDLVLVGYWCLFDAVLVFGLYLWALLRRVRLHLAVSPAKVRGMLGFSGFLFIEAIAIALFQQVDRVIVGITLGPALAGVYSVGTGLGLRTSMIVGQVTEVMIPYASLKDFLNDRSRLYEIYGKLSRYISLFVASLGGVLVLWMDQILRLWISADYAAHYSQAFRLMVIGYGWLSLSRPAHQTLTGMGKVKVTSFIYCLSTLAMLASLYLLSKSFGFVGAALANFLPALLLIMNLYTYRQLSGHIALREVFADLKWGLLVPGLLYLLLLFEPAIWLKALMTLALGLFLAMLLLRDKWVQPRLVSQVKRMLARFFTYA